MKVAGFKIWLIVLLLATSGCGERVRPVTGGTPGNLRTPQGPVGEMQVNVFQKANEAWQPVGFGVSAVDGTFALFKNQATGPLELSPGEYRCTIESAGAPATVPPEYSRAETSPLHITWPTPQARLDLIAPIKLAP